MASERFNKAFNALTKAYFDGTLAAGHCGCCAVGNMCADAAGILITKEDVERVSNNPFSNDWSNGRLIANIWAKFYSNIENVGGTGYTTLEICRIERAFEQRSRIKINYYASYSEEQILEDQYAGLCAVIDVLMELDEDNIDPEPFKSKLRKHPKLLQNAGI